MLLVGELLLLDSLLVLETQVGEALLSSGLLLLQMHLQKLLRMTMGEEIVRSLQLLLDILHAVSSDQTPPAEVAALV